MPLRDSFQLLNRLIPPKIDTSIQAGSKITAKGQSMAYFFEKHSKINMLDRQRGSQAIR